LGAGHQRCESLGQQIQIGQTIEGTPDKFLVGGNVETGAKRANDVLDRGRTVGETPHQRRHPIKPGQFPPVQILDDNDVARLGRDAAIHLGLWKTSHASPLNRHPNGTNADNNGGHSHRRAVKTVWGLSQHQRRPVALRGGRQHSQASQPY
jgi:hypothetical protein